MRSSLFSGLLALSALALGCSATVDVAPVVSQDRASRLSGGKLAPSAIVHADGSRSTLPADATVTPSVGEATGKATIPNARGLTVVHVGPNDVIQVDGDDRITAVRMADGSTVRFQPGTAFSPEGSPIVRGRLAEGERTVELAPTDKIEMTGTLEDGDEIVGVGHVETSRFTFALVFGGILTGLAYIPTAVVGVESSRKADRILLLPVLGPFIDLAGRGTCQTPAEVASSNDIPVDPCIAETGNKVGLVTSGVAQLVGSILFAVGLPAHAYLVDGAPHQAKTGTKSGRRPSFFSLSVAPYNERGATGLSAVGTF